MAFSRLAKQNLDFYLNQSQIHGVQEISASYDLPLVDTKFLGMTNSSYTPNGPQGGSLSVTSYLSASNDFLPYTGDFGVYGYVTKKNNPSNNIIFGFASGYLSSYTIAAQVGQLPTAKATFSIFDNAGSVSPTGSYNTSTIPTLANSNTISMSIGDFSTNRVLSFDFSILVPRSAIYYIGNRNPAIVTPVYPVEVQGNFVIQIDDYTFTNFNVLPALTAKNNNFSISMLDFTGGAINLDFTNRLSYFILNGEEFAASVTSPGTATLKYRGYFK